MILSHLKESFSKYKLTTSLDNHDIYEEGPPKKSRNYLLGDPKKPWNCLLEAL